MDLLMVDSELVALYARFVAIKKRLVNLNAELDNVSELIRQKGV